MTELDKHQGRKWDINTRRSALDPYDVECERNPYTDKHQFIGYYMLLYLSNAICMYQVKCIKSSSENILWTNATLTKASLTHRRHPGKQSLCYFTNEHRTHRFLYHVITNAAQNGPFDFAEATCSHDDHIHVILQGTFDDVIPGFCSGSC